MTVDVIHADCRCALAAMASESIDSVVTDPPYHLTTGKKGGTGEASVDLDSPYGRSRITAGFMGKQWDGGDVAFQPDLWRAVLRVLKPGGHVLAFGGTRTYHRLACAIEDAGFEIRDQIGWLYGTGFPKSHNLDGDWRGWGTALKPAWEPIVVARKPLIGTVAENVQTHRVGALNINGCRIPTDDNLNGGAYAAEGGRSVSGSLHGGSGMNQPGKTTGKEFTPPPGRWPANIIHDGSDEVIAAFPANAGGGYGTENKTSSGVYGAYSGATKGRLVGFGDAGSAARFFYTAKASKAERQGSKHPTVKPLALMRYLCRLVTPPGGTVLDPFAGTGTTGQAAREEGFNAVLIEREDEYVADIRRRLGIEDKISDALRGLGAAVDANIGARS